MNFLFQTEEPVMLLVLISDAKVLLFSFAAKLNRRVM